MKKTNEITDTPDPSNVGSTLPLEFFNMYFNIPNQFY